MAIRRVWPLLVIGGLAASGCLRQFVPSPFGTPLDEACSTFGTLEGVRLDTFRLGPAEFAVPKGWTTLSNSAQELQLSRIDAELHIWLGTRFVFPAIPPRASIRCILARGDTTVTIEAVRLDGFNYRVDAEWEPKIHGRYFYMQWQTRYVEHLKQVRAIVERVRFPVDNLRSTGRGRSSAQRTGQRGEVYHDDGCGNTGTYTSAGETR